MYAHRHQALFFALTLRNVRCCKRFIHFTCCFSFDCCLNDSFRYFSLACVRHKKHVIPINCSKHILRHFCGQFLCAQLARSDGCLFSICWPPIMPLSPIGHIKFAFVPLLCYELANPYTSRERAHNGNVHTKAVQCTILWHLTSFRSSCILRCAL